jgi:hypothetical protein
MESYFGAIENDQMALNDIGRLANQYWLEIPDHYPRVLLHEHVVMPNHVHGIIELKPAEDDVLDTPHVGPCHGMALQVKKYDGAQHHPELSFQFGIFAKILSDEKNKK